MSWISYLPWGGTACIRIFLPVHILVWMNLTDVHWLRFLEKEIRSHASHRRIRNRNKNFRVVIEQLSAIRNDHAVLHGKYRSQIDFDGALSIEDCLYGGEVKTNIFNTKCISVFDGNTAYCRWLFRCGR